MREAQRRERRAGVVAERDRVGPIVGLASIVIDRALERGGSFFLTYHRWAAKEQMLTAYPQFPKFLELKRKFDPEERFQSEWYRHWRRVFGGAE